jgi:energy-coupling factor transporter ATP-binding protein EcfA2
MRTQFGWVEKDSKFIMGDKEITKDGTFYSPPTTATEFFADNIHAKGEFDKWKEVFNLYALPGMEPHAFATLTAFGSPLMPFTGLDGAILNVIYEQAGSGKSTILRMCNSVYGEPKKMMAIEKDTINAKMQQLGVMNNMPNTIDEITNMRPAEFSDLAYGISHGRGKNRLKGSENAMRLNNTTWKNMTLASANASFHEKLSAFKSTPDGESVRLMEYKIEPNDVIGVARGKEMFDHQLQENYGHAGEIYISWLVNNLEEAKGLVKKVQARIDKEVQFTSRERYWSAQAACNITGGLIARSLGLHDYDMGRVYAWMKTMLSEMRLDVKPPSANPVTALGEFINTYISNALVVNGEVDARSNLSAMPILEPRGELLIRYEPDTKELYVAAKQFKEFCVKQQTNYRNTIAELTAMGVFIESTNKRMSKGMRVVSPPVRVLRFNASTSEFLQMDTFIKQDENRDSLVSD